MNYFDSGDIELIQFKVIFFSSMKQKHCRWWNNKWSWYTINFIIEFCAISSAKSLVLVAGTRSHETTNQPTTLLATRSPEQKFNSFEQYTPLRPVHTSPLLRHTQPALRPFVADISNWNETLRVKSGT